MLDNNITPSGDAGKDKMVFATNYIIVSRYDAIEQFRKGLQSVDTSFASTENYNMMKKYLQTSNVQITLDEFVGLLEIKRDCVEGSNRWVMLDAAVCDLEMCLASIVNGDFDGITLSDVLFFFTGYDRIPPYGLNGYIQVNFDDVLVLPKVSTCSMMVTLPVNNIETAMKTALSFGCGFGEL